MTLKEISKVAAGTLLLGVLAAAPSQAQEHWLGMTWGASTPSGDTKDFASGTSWRNFGVEYANFFKPNASWGIVAAWSVFADRVEDVTTSFEGLDVNGTHVRYVNAFPIMATGRYYLAGGGRGRARTGSPGFWVGAGAGALIAENRLDVGTITAKETNWHLAIAPEAGVSYAMSRDFQLFGQARYTYGFKTGEMAPSFFNFNVGIAWRN